ncbi:N-acetyl-alpha-D-glucosaminyl L-malate synthase BshA [soil metagenome]
MRIAQVSISYKPILGGQEVYIDELNRVLTEAGHTTHTFQRDNGYKDPAITLVSHPKFLKPVMGFNVGLLKFVASLRTYKRLVIHYPDHYPTLNWHKGAVVLTHGVNWELDAPKKRERRVQLAMYSLKKAPVLVANDTHFYRTLGIEVEAGTHAFSEVAPNRWYIPNCVDTNIFKKTTPHPKLPAGELIIVPRNITPARGVHLAVAAFVRIAEHIPQATMVVVGQALPTLESEAYFQSIKDQVAEANLEDRVMFLGSIPHDEMPAIFSGASLTVIPTLANEGTALSALESMSCGVPTVVTAVAGLKDLPAVQALPTPESLSDAMLSTFRHPEIGAVQQATVTAEFNLDRWAKAWRNVLETPPHA